MLGDWVCGLGKRRSFTGARSSRSRLSRGRARASRRVLECLEDRSLPSATVYTVNLTSDSGASTSATSGDLRYCVTQADNSLLNPQGSLIQFDSTVFSSPTQIVTGSTLELANDVTIEGLGASIVSVVAASGSNFSVFTVDTGVTATISGISIEGGAGQAVQPIPDPFNQIANSAIGGGGILNEGTLFLDSSAVVDNDVPLGGNSLPALGGGIYNSGALTVTNSTFAGNSADFGGAIFNAGVLSIATSLIGPSNGVGGNSATAGGGVFNDNGLGVLISNSTLSGNTATQAGGGIDNSGTGTMTVDDVTMIGNSTGGSGGAIENTAILTVQNGSTLSANSATIGGGAIDNVGTLTVTASTLGAFSSFAGNSAGSGGAIENAASLTVGPNCTLSGNQATSGDGGAIDNSATGSALVESTTLSNNTSQGNGGAIDTEGSLTVDACIVTGNIATTGNGGGVNNNSFAAATVGLRDSTLSGNSATTGNGGGVSNSNFSAITITNCSITGNSAASGGGLEILSSGKVIVGSSTFSTNSASSGGAIQDSGTLSMTNSTLYGNTTGSGGGGGLAVSGSGASAALTNVTVTANSTNQGVGGGINVAAGDVLTLNNTLVAGNLQTSTPGPDDLAGAVATSSSFNLIGVGTNLSGITNGKQGNQIGTSAAPIGAKLGPLSNNGGSTETVALLPGSPAIDAGSNLAASSAGLTVDQRGSGYTRRANGAGSTTVDIGSFEVQNYVVTVATDPVTAGTTRQLSLRQAIVLANTHATDSVHITFANNVTGTITLDNTQGTLEIGSNQNITGPGATALTIKEATPSTNFSVFTVDPNTTVYVSGLTITGGNAAVNGGGVNNGGTLLLTDSVLSKNAATLGGGGIYNSGVLTALNVTFSGNSAQAGGAIDNQGLLILGDGALSGNSAVNGGGLYNAGPLTAFNETFAGNTAVNGGGLYSNAGTATLTNDTITANRASGASPAGGGIFVNGGSVLLNNTIVAGNFIGGSPSTTSDDISGTVNPASAFNLIGTGGAGGLTNGNGNQINVANPGLGSLANNGGTTQTTALLPGSPAIDAGSNALAVDPLGNPLLTDQRDPGHVRIANGGISTTVDIGAFELQNYVVTTTADSSSGASMSLRQAMTIANGDGDSRITFAPNVTGTIGLFSSALPTISADVAIVGPGASSLTVARTTFFPISIFVKFPIFAINPGVTASISGLTITGGASQDAGGGINNGGVLTVNGCAIVGNSAPNGGGVNNYGSLSLWNSTISGNSTTGEGGGLNDNGTLTIVNSTIVGNTALAGAGLSLNSGTASLINDTITANKVTNKTAIGGGIEVAVLPLTLTNTIVAGNLRTSGNTTVADDVNGALSTSSTHNLFGTGGSGGLTSTNSVGNLFNVSAPKLGALANNGGPTQTVALLAGSPAIDGGIVVAGVSTDERGATRGPAGINAGATPDIGAYEASSSYIVTSVSGGTQVGSLRGAISWADLSSNANAANTAHPSANTVSFDATGVFSTPQTITPAQVPLVLNNVTTPTVILGPGANLLTVNGNSAGTVFQVAAKTTVTISGLTISGGSAGAFGSGGGVSNAGTTTLNSDVVSGNQAASGGGVGNSGTLVVVNSTVSGNTASGQGGGINSTGTLTLVNSTVYGNTAATGGGLGVSSSGKTVVTNATITANRSTSTPANNGSSGGGIKVVFGSVVVRNSIVAGNFRGASPSTTADDVSGTLGTTSGYSLFGTGGSGGLTSANSVGNLFNVSNPGLGTLANNGGTTPTVALLAGSAAIDGGNNAFAVDAQGIPLVYDQRGNPHPRVFNGKVDMGAFEFGS